MATVPRPGIGPTMRTDAVLRARARSSARFTTRLIFVPDEGSNSYEVMMGPGLTWTMRPSTSKSRSFRRRVSAFSWSCSWVIDFWSAGGVWSRPMGGSWKDSAPPRPKSNVSCQTRPSLPPPRPRRDSTTTGGGGGSWTAVPIIAAASRPSGSGNDVAFVIEELQDGAAWRRRSRASFEASTRDSAA